MCGLGAAANVVAIVIAVSVPASQAQELEPRAYSVSPRGLNFAVFGFSRSSGDISFDPSLPIDDANATLHTTSFAYVRSINFLGRSANAGLYVPYLWGTVEGSINGSVQSARRSGLADPGFRFAVNLHGAPAMDREQFAHYRQTTNVGASLIVSVPLGQYDSSRAINISSHRWGVRPEAGVSQRLGQWYLDFYLGVWIFTPNHDYQGQTRRQDPIGSAQVHLSYNFTRRLWAALDTNFYTGGRTSIDGIARADLQRNSRVGGTLSAPIGQHHSMKFSVARGAVTNIGADFLSVGIAYQYLWGGGL
jgi:hypothetical protein